MSEHATPRAQKWGRVFRSNFTLAAASLLPVAVLVVRAQAALCQGMQGRIFEDYIQGTLGAVFEARVLMRLLIASVWTLLPGGYFPSHVNVLLQIGFTWAGLVACFLVARQFLSYTAALAVSFLVSLWLLWGMLPMGFSLAYPYDLPAFAFSALGMLAILRWDVTGFAAVILFGTLNKETIVWLLPVFAFTAARRETACRALALSVLMAILFAVVYVGVRWGIQARVPRLGFVTIDLVEDKVAGISRVATNLRELLWVRHGTPTENVYWFATLFVPGLLAWRKLSAAIRLFYSGAALLCAANFICGNIWEVRIFNEIVPLGALSAVVALSHWLGEKPITANEREITDE